jgi:hypothetical protein
MPVNWRDHPKIAIIKEVKNRTGAGLKDTKDMVEAVGDEFDNSTINALIIAEAAHRLRPNLFAPVLTEPNYKELWNDLKGMTEYSFQEEMNRMEKQAAGQTERARSIKILVDSLREALNRTFYNLTFEGGGVVAFTSYEEGLRPHRLQCMDTTTVRETLRSEFETWLSSTIR